MNRWVEKTRREIKKRVFPKNLLKQFKLNKSSDK